MLGYLLSRLLVITCGLLYPAFCSYKAIKEKNARGYIRWMTYWIVFALFTTAEVIIEPLLAFWFPFYYELKICLILTLVSSGGTQFAYRRLIHPRLVQHEEMIDAFLRDFKSKVTDYLYRWGSQLLASASDNIWRAALRARLHMGDRSVDQDYTNQLTGQRDVADGQGALTRSYSYQSREKLDEILRNGNDGMWSEDDFPRASPTSTQRPQPNESGPRTRSKKGMPKPPDSPVGLEIDDIPLPVKFGWFPSGSRSSASTKHNPKVSKQTSRSPMSSASHYDFSDVRPGFLDFEENICEKSKANRPQVKVVAKTILHGFEAKGRPGGEGRRSSPGCRLPSSSLRGSVSESNVTVRSTRASRSVLSSDVTTP